MEVRGYIREFWSELWNPDNRVWQFIDRILFLLLPVITLLLVIIPKAQRWKDIMTNLTWIIPLSIWILFLLLIVPYRLANKKQQELNVAKQKIQELETEFQKPKLFEVVCPTISLGLPINRLDDGSYRASAVSIGINPIMILHRGDLTTITHFIMSPVIMFTRTDGWETTDAIQVTSGPNFMTTLLTQGFAWDTHNPQQWVLNGLPLIMAKDEKLTLPTIIVSVSNGNEVGVHFEKKEICTLLMRFSIRTDKGVPPIPDHQILLTMNDIKDSLSKFGIKPKPEGGATQ